MKKWFKKYLPTTSINSKELSPLKSFFNAKCFWSYEQPYISRGIAAGLAGAVVPGFQLFYAAILVILLRGNLPIALLCTLITNPLTFIPITYFIYYVGKLIIGNGNTNYVPQEFQWDFSSFHAFWTNVSTWFLQFGKAFFVGLPVVSICLGLTGYIVSMLVLKAATWLFPKKKKLKGNS